MILAAALATAAFAFGVLVVVALVALLVVRLLEWMDVAGHDAPGDEDEFSVMLSEPAWWPEFERRFADYAASRRRPRLS